MGYQCWVQLTDLKGRHSIQIKFGNMYGGHSQNTLCHIPEIQWRMWVILEYCQVPSTWVYKVCGEQFEGSTCHSMYMFFLFSPWLSVHWFIFESLSKMPKLLIFNLIFELIFLRVIRNIYIIKFYMQFAVINFMPILLKVFHIYQSLYIYPLIYVISLIWYHSIHLYITCTIDFVTGK